MHYHVSMRAVSNPVSSSNKLFTRQRWKRNIHLTNRFHVDVRLFSNRSKMTSKCGKNKKAAHEAQPSVSLMNDCRKDVQLFSKVAVKF